MRRTFAAAYIVYRICKEKSRAFITRLKMFMRGVYIAEGARIPGNGNLEFGTGVVIQRFGVINSAFRASIKIGEDSRIGAFSVISAIEYIEIGRDVLIADRFFASDHQHESTLKNIPIIRQGASASKPIYIGDGCWIGISVSIMPGVTLGPGCVVGAGSVVTKSFSPNSILMGVPARLIGSRFE